MIPVLFAMPGNEAFTLHLDRAMSCEVGRLEVRRFPDGESSVRLLSPVHERDVVFVCTLDRPDEKVIQLYFAVSIARQLGARRIGVIAPYLSYMRQDAQFREGEGITSTYFARFLSDFCDWLVTVDPHLHRHHRLNEIYSIPTKIVHAAPSIARWIDENIENPFIVGPDAESEQWAGKVAKALDCPCIILEKTRSGDREVAVSAPDVSARGQGMPVIVDDIASTGKTMIAAAERLRAAGLPRPVCVAIHPVFCDGAFEELSDCAERIVSCNTIAHFSNGIDIAEAVAVAAVELMAVLPVGEM